MTSHRHLSNTASPVWLRSLVWELAWGGDVKRPPPPSQWCSTETPIKRGLYPYHHYQHRNIENHWADCVAKAVCLSCRQMAGRSAARPAGRRRRLPVRCAGRFCGVSGAVRPVGAAPGHLCVCAVCRFGMTIVFSSVTEADPSCRVSL